MLKLDKKFEFIFELISLTSVPNYSQICCQGFAIVKQDVVLIILTLCVVMLCWQTSSMSVASQLLGPQLCCIKLSVHISSFVNQYVAKERYQWHTRTVLIGLKVMTHSFLTLLRVPEP